MTNVFQSTNSAGGLVFSDKRTPGVPSQYIGNTADGRVHTVEAQRKQKSAPLAKSSAEVAQEKARMELETKDKPAYDDLQAKEDAAYKKASAAYEPYSQAYSKLNNDLQTVNAGFIDSKNIHDTVGGITAAVGLITKRAPPQAQAVAKVVIFLVDAGNDVTRAKVEKAKGSETKLDKASEKLGQLGAHGKNAVEAGEALAQAEERSFYNTIAKKVGALAKSGPVQSTPFGLGLGVASDAVSIFGAGVEARKPADLLDGRIGTDKELDEIGDRIEHTSGGWPSNFNAHKEELKGDVKDLKEKLKEYEEANAEYLLLRAELQEAATTFVNKAKAANVPVSF